MLNWIGTKSSRYPPVSGPEKVEGWNGWTEELIRHLNGRENIDAEIVGLSVTTVVQQCLSEDEKNYRETMKRLNGEPQAHNVKFKDKTIEIRGLEFFEKKIVIDIDLLSFDNGKIGFSRPEGPQGFLYFCSKNPVNMPQNREEGQKYKTPCIHITLYDIDDVILNALRNGSISGRRTAQKPSLGIWLSSEICLSLEDFQKSKGKVPAHHRRDILSVSVTEFW